MLLSFQAAGQSLPQPENLVSSTSIDQGHKELKALRNAIHLVLQKHRNSNAQQQDISTQFPTEDARAVAICLTVTLGVFGAHRIYLGTTDYVPIFYTLTIGGGLGILPLVDLFHLCLKKDISSYYQNEKLIMWGGN